MFSDVRAEISGADVAICHQETPLSATDTALSGYPIFNSPREIAPALQAAGLVGKAKKRGRHHKRRPRRPLPGMMLHIDGSTHAWLGPDHERFDLVTVMDDATSEIYYARFVEQESTASVLAALRSVVQTQGVFCSLYSDRASHFVITPTGATKPDRSLRTQVGRALEQLGIELIHANSPQARGRCER